jgi:cyclic pyranopterin phosphate synthase
MVDVSNKIPTRRAATASGRIVLNRDAFSLLVDGDHDKLFNLPEVEDDTRYTANVVKGKHKARSKGDVLTTAQLAAIMASKQTSSLIPLCHPLPVTHVHAGFALEPETLSVQCTATVRCDGKTGVEMEALTAVSIGLLTIWDMVKAVAGKEMIVSTDLPHL